MFYELINTTINNFNYLVANMHFHYHALHTCCIHTFHTWLIIFNHVVVVGWVTFYFN